MKNFESLFNDVFGDNKNKKNKIEERPELAKQYLITQIKSEEISKTNSTNKRA